MSTQTTNYGFVKPTADEFYDVAVQNGNWDKADQKLKEHDSSLSERVKQLGGGFLINGDFRINQRVKSGTVTLTAGQYGHDRWKAGASGCTYTFALNSGVTIITITAGSLIQVVEGNDLQAGTYVLSWGGTSTGKIGTGSYSASGTTASVTGGTNLSIEFSTGTLYNAKLEKGTIITPFIPRTFLEELLLCMRYYEKSFAYGIAPYHSGYLEGFSLAGIGVNNTATQVTCGIPFKVEKRVSPTITFYRAQGGTTVDGNWATWDTGDHLNLVPTATSFSTKFQVVLGATGLTAGQACKVFGNWTADAEL